jgi:Ni,Fe-hydrogenase maturation factor
MPPKIFIFGNPLLKEDSLPLKMMPSLKEALPDIDFIELDPNEDLESLEKEANIIDTVFGIEKVRVIEDIDSIQESPKLSMHDFDLGFNLKLLKKMGRLETVRIFGVPPEIKEEDALEQLIPLLKSI